MCMMYLMRKKEVIFGIVAMIDIGIAYKFKNEHFLIPVVFALLFIFSLIWFGKYWNYAFPIGANAERPITKETPTSILALLGWVVLLMLTILLIIKYI